MRPRGTSEKASEGRPGLLKRSGRKVEGSRTSRSKWIARRLLEQITFHNPENGVCVLWAKARKHRDLVTVIGHVSAGEWITASGE
jgi:hypothetical protein